MKKYSEQIQRFGRSLLLPIGVMAPVGLLLGLSAAFTQSYMIDLLPFLGNPTVKLIFTSIRQISDLIFGNIPIMFAMGVAYGMAKRDKGIAVFSSVMAYLILLINDENLAVSFRTADYRRQYRRRGSGDGLRYADVKRQRFRRHHRRSGRRLGFRQVL